MTKDWVQHIGDDQLVYGMPKRMVGVSTQESLARFKKAEAAHEKSRQSKRFDPKGDYYWTVHPKPKACDTCKAMEGKEFMEEPERPHPNCKCEIKKHPLRRPKRYINGSLTGHSREVFVGGRQVDIFFEGISGGITSGVHLYSSQGHSEQIACMPFSSNSTTLIAAGDPPVSWSIQLVAAGSDNVMINYTIEYEEWNE
ncbi:hypothetical protein [Desulfovibrio sp. Huiquan2017]|uniref:hypothetical protein n=1 Tax=Desulfovibrio sp. Huiquan2017 TaxID=2816861 RepID=UPI001A92B620|nr:hypothetical protein [Desulfovibrio sp. Huiquan2017]